MITEEMKKEIISSWQKGDGISQISREKGVSRPTVRKIIEEHKENRKWWLVRTYNEDGFIQLVVNTKYKSKNKEGEPLYRLAHGVEYWEVDGLIRSIVKSETADEIRENFLRDPPRISIIYVKESELLPQVKIKRYGMYYTLSLCSEPT